MRQLILGSIVVSQMGFCGAYMIFVAENMQSFVMGVTHCAKLIGVQYFIFMQLIVFLPLVLIRDLAKLSTTALIADVFILAGLIYIFGSEVSIISQRGIQDVALFNPKDFPLFVGYVSSILACFASLICCQDRRILIRRYWLGGWPFHWMIQRFSSLSLRLSQSPTL